MNKNIHETLKRDLPSASNEEVEWDIARVLNRLQSKTDTATEEPIDERIAAFERTASTSSLRRFAAIPAAAAILLAVFFAVTWRQDAFAVVEKVDGNLYRRVDGKNVAIRVGEKIPAGTAVRTDDGAAAVLKLHDGARVEMPEKSEVVFEHADTGTRIRLNDGSVKVTPSSEPDGKLVVQNRELTVPVVAPMFQAAQPQKPQEPRLAFEVASIRPSAVGPSTPGARGGGPNPAGNGCGGPGMPQLDPHLLVANNFSLFNLITKAYPEWSGAYLGCMGVIPANLLTGGESWMRTELWDIRATIPQGTPSYTGSQFWEGQAPEIQKMLQTLLAERFKLVLRRETKTMPVYFLTVAKGGPKFNGIHPSVSANAVFLQDGKKVGPTEVRGTSMMTILKDADGKSFTLSSVLNQTMPDFAETLIPNARRVVLDRTGLTGEYSFYMELGIDPAGPLAILGAIDASRPKQMEALEEVGLKLETGTAPVEVWTVEHAERPTEN